MIYVRLFIFFGVVLFWSLLEAQGASREVSSQFCADYLLRLEEKFNIPRYLLGAMAKVESGRRVEHKKPLRIWPWTLNVEGKGYFFPTKKAALIALKNFIKKGIKNIDVGCMQVNLRHHGHGFKSPEEALDPKKNIDYAVEYLRNLKNTHRSWTQAIGRYHSGRHSRQIAYRKRVYAMWATERRLGFQQWLSKNRAHRSVRTASLGRAS